MKYKLTEPKHQETIQEEILSRRGIENPQAYMNTTDKDILPYSLFGDVMSEAYNVLKEVIDSGGGVSTLVDVDGDGYFSSALLYQYLKKAFNIEIGYYIHNSKEHGLSDKELFPKIEEDVKSGKLKLLFLPDSGTGDYKESKIIADLGCKIIVLDHHERGKIDNKSAIVINPHYVENYPNMDSSGTMVTWKFLKAIDDFEWTNYTADYFDLVACSTISDSMNIQNLENRHFITLGLSDIKNKFLSEMISGDYRIKNSPPTIIDIAFFLIPLINGNVRSGSFEEKELMFRAMCELDETFLYTKRDKTVINESIFTRASRLCGNAKARQDKKIEKGIEIVLEDIEKFKRNDNKILFALCDDRLDRAFSGLTAQKLASKFNKPVVLLRENEKGDYFSGSIRNFQDSPLTNLKGFLESLGYVAFLSGHMNAAGIGMSKKQLIKNIELSNDKLKDYDFTPVHNIDFEFDYSEISNLNNILLPIHNLKQYWGQGISETKILIHNIPVNSGKISFFGAKEKSEKKNNYKFEISEEFGIDIMKFRADDDDYIFKNFGQSDGEFSWNGEDFMIDVIVKVARSEFNGEQRWSLIIEEYQVLP